MATPRNSHLTFVANRGVGRHGWLRLTPAYSVDLVRSEVDSLATPAVVVDPFSGTGTTALAAAEHGLVGQAIDVNPFLVWLGTVKTTNYATYDTDEARTVAEDVVDLAARLEATAAELWLPPLHNIERWWPEGALRALAAIKHALDATSMRATARDLLLVAFCRTLIKVSNAAFNHQSMSFKDAVAHTGSWESAEYAATLARYLEDATLIADEARADLLGSAKLVLGDSRGTAPDMPLADLLLTSPPYVNRMSYIRELRPYMYWLGYLEDAVEASDLDWKAIGGTWGSATSKVGKWRPERAGTPVDDLMEPLCDAICESGARNAPLLANYVRKYFHDMWEHFQFAQGLVRPGGNAVYIIGNSTFYGQVVPAEDWYGRMLSALGYRNVEIENIRKRNSNKHLYEYRVSAERPSLG